MLQENFLFSATVRKTYPWESLAPLDEVMKAAISPRPIGSHLSFPRVMTRPWVNGESGFQAVRNNGLPLPGLS